MSEFFYSGVALEFAILFMLIEGVALPLIWRYRAPRGDISGILISLFSGALLMTAVYCAVIQASWQWLAMCLLGSFLAHVLDLRRRWRSDHQIRELEKLTLHRGAVNARVI